MGWARTEKRALAETLRSTDPSAATLCEGWDVRRLLAHLVQREQDARGSVADLVQRAEPGQEKNLGKLVAGAADPTGYAALVDRFLAGPPRWSPFSWASDQVNLLEYVVHHEDVRRGAVPAPPRELPANLRDKIWRQLPLMARLRLRGAPVGVVLALPDGTTAPVRVGTPAVTLTGDPVELALYVTGRRQAAAVQVSGPPAAVAEFQTWLAAG